MAGVPESNSKVACCESKKEAKIATGLGGLCIVLSALSFWYDHYCGTGSLDVPNGALGIVGVVAFLLGVCSFGKISFRNSSEEKPVTVFMGTSSVNSDNRAYSALPEAPK